MKPVTRNLQPLFLVAVLLLSACAAPTGTVGTGMEETMPPSLTAPSSPPAPPGRIRPAAVAGSWYPDDPEVLARMMDGMLAAVEPVDGAPLALIVPHAGYVYSGPVAAAGFRQLEEGEYDTAIIIAADHQAPLSHPISIWAEGGFETPLGVVPVNVELAQALIEASPSISSDLAAHEYEHPIEIELPFLQRVCPTCTIVPILMGTDDDEAVQALSDALLSTLPGHRAVLIASSDLSHYPSQEDAVRLDSATLAAIETGDPNVLRATIAQTMARGVPNLVTCACGEAPIRVTMRVAAGLGADTITVLRYANSADSPYGDKKQAVGYGAVMFWHYEPPDLTPQRQGELLALARTTLATWLEESAIPPYETQDPVLSRRSGVFVTLKGRNSIAPLRGCIGHIRADLPLYQAVQEMAVAAATHDPRFPPLTVDELDQVTIEISILSPLRRVTDLSQIEVGIHGLMIFKEGRQGLLLPQVPVEEGWNRPDFLEGLCQKAGLPEGCWREGADLYAFTAIVFGEP